MPRRKVNLPLIEVIGVSIVLHLVALLVLGGLTVWQMANNTDAEFEAPPVQPQEPIEPKELKVRLERTQKQTQQPTRVLQVQNISNIDIAKLDIDIPKMSAKVSVGTNVGGGIGRGIGGQGLNMSKSAVNFFGIKSGGENIVFIVDVTRSMLEPERGDVWGFNRVKEEIGRMIDGLSGGTLFNVYAYERGLDVFNLKPLPATDTNKAAAKNWINEYWKFDGPNITGKRGANSNNYRPTFTDDMNIRRTKIQATGSGENWDAIRVPLPEDEIGFTNNSSSRMELALLAALENNADAIFVITDGTPAIAREIEDEAFETWRKRRAEWERNKQELDVNSPEWKKYREELAEFNKKVADYQAERARKGLPPEIREGGIPGGFKRPRPPGGGAPGISNTRMSFGEIGDMLRNRAKDLYESRDRRPPPIHIVGYGVSEEAAENLEELQSSFPGSRYRDLNSRELKQPDDTEKSDSLL